jgi:hypothetical protein
MLGKIVNLALQMGDGALSTRRRGRARRLTWINASCGSCCK